MRVCLLAAVAGLLVSGCTTAAYRPTNGFVGLTRGSVETFTALVPSSTGPGTCETPANAPIEPEGRVVAMVYGEPIQQQVTVHFDGAGVPTALIDVRGDLSDPEHSTGDRTTIGLYLNEDYAVLSNRPRAGQPTMLEVPLDQAYSSDRLGNPSAVLQRVLAACGGAI